MVHDAFCNCEDCYFARGGARCPTCGAIVGQGCGVDHSQRPPASSAEQRAALAATNHIAARAVDPFFAAQLQAIMLYGPKAAPTINTPSGKRPKPRRRGFFD